MAIHKAPGYAALPPSSPAPIERLGKSGRAQLLKRARRVGDWSSIRGIPIWLTEGERNAIALARSGSRPGSAKKSPKKSSKDEELEEAIDVAMRSGHYTMR